MSKTMDNSGPELLTLEEAAETLRVDYRTVYRMVRAGELPALRIDLGDDPDAGLSELLAAFTEALA